MVKIRFIAAKLDLNWMTVMENMFTCPLMDSTIVIRPGYGRTVSSILVAADVMGLSALTASVSIGHCGTTTRKKRVESAREIEDGLLVPPMVDLDFLPENPEHPAVPLFHIRNMGPSLIYQVIEG